MANALRQPARTAPVEFALGDVVRLRKPHPCGGFEWTVVRLGADIGLRCNACQRKVLLPRRTVERRLKTFLSRAQPPAATTGSSPAAPPVPDAAETR